MMGSLRTRLVDGRTIDALLAAAVLAAAVVERLTTDSNTAQFLIALLLPLPILARRTATVLACVGLLVVVTALVAAGLSTHGASTAWMVALLLAYASGRHARRWQGLPELAVLVVADEVLWGAAQDSVASDLFFPAVFTVCAWAVARWVRYDVRIAAQVHEESARILERAERDREAARAGERRRIAREMHDVIAHSVSVMVVQAGGARRILTTDPARAAEAAGLIEATGREALEELRTLLGVIGAEPDSGVAPAPSLARLAGLVERGHDAGLEIEVSTAGDLTTLPAGLDVAAYRIVQEALTNALRHAGAVAVCVDLRRDGDTLSIDVVNAPPGPDHDPKLTRPGGHGMMGMAERATLYRGDLVAGPTADGGFSVRTRLTFEDHRMETAS
ncbi:MAG: histidine kinase [Patulibacter minatonensis]